MTPPDSGAHTKKVGLTERVRFNKHSARHSNNLSNTLQNHLESLFECSSSSGSRVAAGKPSSNRGTRTLLYGQVESVEQGCHAVVRTDRQVESVEEVCFLHRHTRVPGLHHRYDVGHTASRNSGRKWSRARLRTFTSCRRHASTMLRLCGPSSATGRPRKPPVGRTSPVLCAAHGAGEHPDTHFHGGVGQAVACLLM